MSIEQQEEYKKDLFRKVSIMLSPSEKLLFLIASYLGIKLSIGFAQSITARLIALAVNRTNIKITL